MPDLPEYEAADFAIDINGDSMEPDFSHDDIALVQQDAELFPGIKIIKNIPIHDGDNVVCMGKVIGKVKTDEGGI